MITLELLRSLVPQDGSLESIFLMILNTVCERKDYLLKTISTDEGWGGGEYTGIFFPKNEVYTKDVEGYFEDAVQLAYFSPGSEKVFDGKEEVYSFTMNYEVAYRYLKLGCNALIEKNPEDREALEEACKGFRERHNIKEEDPDFNYFDILGNMDKYLVWLWESDECKEII